MVRQGADLSVGECAGLVGAEPELRAAAALVNRFDFKV